jgi:hypothetical protein
MKAFRGTVLALLVLVALVAAFQWLQPRELTPKERKALKDKPQGVELFVFEKADLTRVEVTRPDGSIVLSEQGDHWIIEGENLRAARSMVNRVKHQLHDLVARATVVENPEEPALYGLGPSAIHVKITFRDGTEREFDAGDPNPSGVSFYLRPTPGDAIYTVKKSAVDYYSLSLSEFRERRFASFDSKDVDALDATLPDGSRLAFQRTGEHAWDMLAPRTIAANDSEVRSLMGRVSAMKAAAFVSDSPDDLGKYGLDHPRLRIALRFSGREPSTLLVGKQTGEKDGEYTLSWVKLEEEPSIYTARDGLVEDYVQPWETFRLKRFARTEQNDLVTIVATLHDTGDDADLNGTVTVHKAADKWQWDDGVIVPGSTPRRVATRCADVSADEFVQEQPDDRRFGFDVPLASVVMTDGSGGGRTLLIGKRGPPTTDHEGHEQERYYARTTDFPEVYLVDDGVIDVVKDLMREHGRHARGEAEEAERHERIERDKRPQPGL